MKRKRRIVNKYNNQKLIKAVYILRYSLKHNRLLSDGGFFLQKELILKNKFRK